MNKVQTIEFAEEEVAFLRAAAAFAYLVEDEDASALQAIVSLNSADFGLLTRVNNALSNLSETLLYWGNRRPDVEDMELSLRKARLTIVAKAESMVQEALAMLRDKSA